MSETTTPYINGVWILEKEFPNGGSIIKMRISKDGLDDLVAKATAAMDANGYANLKIGKRQNPQVSKTDASKVIATHTIAIDTWKPDASKPAPAKPVDAPY